MNEISEWFSGRLPEWFDGPAVVTVDRDEILVTGTLKTDGAPTGSEAEGAIARWREETRGARMTIADEAEERYGRKTAWGASVGDVDVVFTQLSVPVMTRLRQPERRVLDTLIAAGVARSRSDALAWCVKLVGENESTWIEALRDALTGVHDVRNAGPSSRR